MFVYRCAALHSSCVSVILCSLASDHHQFQMTDNLPLTVQDLLDLLKNVETEINLCEANLKEEIEKRKKYKVSDTMASHSGRLMTVRCSRDGWFSGFPPGSLRQPFPSACVLT